MCRHTKTWPNHSQIASSGPALYLIRVKRHVYYQMKHVGSDQLKDKYKDIRNLVRSQTRKDTAAHVTNLSKSYSKKFKFYEGGSLSHPSSQA